MASIEIENAKVVRLIPGYGFEVVEEITTRKGDTIKQYFTVWNKSVTVEVGEAVTVAGDFSAKAEEYTGKDNVPRVKVGVSINNAEVLKGGLIEDAPF